MDSVDSESLLYAASGNGIHVLSTKSYDKFHMEDFHHRTRKYKRYTN